MRIRKYTLYEVISIVHGAYQALSVNYHCIEISLKYL